MTRFRPVLLAAALVVAGAASATAQGYGYGHGGGYRPLPDETDVRQNRQMSRIERGYRDGSLTPREAGALMEEQRRIAEVERRAKLDGYVDPYERARLRHMQDNASRNIAAERHDYEGRNAAFDRPWWRRWW
jgi:hypothetical protein